MRTALVLVAILAAGCTAAPPAPPSDADPSDADPTATPIPSPLSSPASPAPTPPTEASAPEEPGPGDPPPPSPAEPTTPAPAPEPAAEPAPAPGPVPAPAQPAPAPPPASAGPGAPVRFQAGADAPDGRRFVSISMSSDATSFAASVRGVPEARLRIDSLARIANVDDITHEVSISTSQLVDARVPRARLLVGGTPIDMLAAAPNLTAYLSPGALVDIGIEIDLAAGTAGETVFAQSVVLEVR